MYYLQREHDDKINSKSYRSIVYYRRKKQQKKETNIPPLPLDTVSQGVKAAKFILAPLENWEMTNRLLTIN